MNYPPLPERYTKKWNIGYKIETLVKPIARAINHPCLEKDGTLKPKSPCRKIRDALNKL